MQSEHANGSSLNLLSGMVPFSQRLPLERAERLKNAAHHLQFGISFLDDALGGIYGNDLILLGAKTGLGKSQLAMLVALHNVKAGKRVHFFALEAEKEEIERRVKYQLITQVFFNLSHQERPQIRMNYLDWYHGRLDKELSFIEEEIDQSEWFPNLFTYYRTGDFTVQEFERIFLGVKDQTDLVVVDHLHYFDLEGTNENQALKDTVKKIRDCALIAGKPILLVAHVRKQDKRLKQLIPDLEDFHGSSDIGKIATKAVTLAPSFEQSTNEHRPTYMQILKCRADGTRTHSVALTAYNYKLQNYEKDYYLGKLSGDGSEFTYFTSAEIPFWAKGAKVKK